jgi:hypothetical protein
MGQVMDFPVDDDFLFALKKYAENSPDITWLITDEDFTVIKMSSKFSEFIRYDGEKYLKLNDLLIEQSASQLEKVKSGTKSLALDFKGYSGMDFSLKCTFELAGSGYVIFGDRYNVTGDELLITMTKLNNELSSALKELDRKNKELEDAKKKIKVLSGLLPVCSYCKKIRNEDQSWTQLESYIDKHSEAEFSHTICPVCMDKYFPE